LIHSLSEVFSECKEKAILLYKIFKFYFIELEKKWTNKILNLKQKINYYKEFCKNILQSKNKDSSFFDSNFINEVIFSHNLDNENLNNHKKLVQQLIQVTNEKRDEIFLLKTKKKILKDELRLWVYDYETLKLNKSLREKINEINLQDIIQNVNDEMFHKPLTRDQKTLLVNADRYSLASENRNYFYDQKKFYLSEIERITKLYEKQYNKKQELKSRIRTLSEQHSKERNTLGKEIEFLREKLAWNKVDRGNQTEVDTFSFNKMKLNNDILKNQNRLVKNKLINYIENIKYNNCRENPISKKSLLSLIAELYSEKIENDNKCEAKEIFKLSLDEYFYLFISEKFKLSKIIKRNCQQTLLAIFKYAEEDPRINLFRKFLGVGEDKYRREILDNYLILIKYLPISFFKLCEYDYKSYLMTLDSCFEIYYNRFRHFNLVSSNKDNLFKNAIVLDGDKQVDDLTFIQKFEIFLLYRMFSQSIIYFNSLANDSKYFKREEGDISSFFSYFRQSNKEFEFIPDKDIIGMLQRNHLLTHSCNINIDAFLSFFMKKYIFKIRIADFLEISLDSINVIYNYLEKLLDKNFKDCDINKSEKLLLKEFETALLKIFANMDNKWKISEYFNKAVVSPDKNYLTREEFISYCLDTKDILLHLFNLSNFG
jgi:hypothetical protein